MSPRQNHPPSINDPKKFSGKFRISTCLHDQRILVNAISVGFRNHSSKIGGEFLSVSIVASREVGLDHTQVHGVVGVATVSGRDGQERLRAVPDHELQERFFGDFWGGPLMMLDP